MTDRLFELDVSKARVEPLTRPSGRVVRVVVDVVAITREFDYVVPPKWVDVVDVGSRVRVPLHGRRVPAWVVELDVEPPDGVELGVVSTWSGHGPPSEVIDLCRWATWRWAGRLPHFLGAASPDRVVRDLPVGRVATPAAVTEAGTSSSLALLDAPRSVVELGPADWGTDIVLGVAARGPVLVVCPDYGHVRRLGAELARSGIRPVTYPDGWAHAAAGASIVIGTRRAVLAPMPELGSIVVLNEHDEALQNEGSPTWHVRELAFERGRRRRVPVVLTSPTPTLEARSRAVVRSPDRSTQRSGWASVVIIDRRDDDRARLGLYSDVLVRSLAEGRGRPGASRVVCVLNRLGRAGLLSCGSCRAPTSCATCSAAVQLDDGRQLVCRHCGATRPPVCQSCGSMVLRQLRIGVTRAREELEALTGEPVAEITGKGRIGPSDARIVVGSEAALHQVEQAGVVAFLEFDQELLAPRYRAAEQALALLVRASAVVGGRAGRVLVQTQQPDHAVLRAAVAGSSDELSASEAARRALLEYPPAASMIVFGGDAASAYIQALVTRGLPTGWRVEPGPSGNVLLRGVDRGPMLDLIAATPRPSGRLRLWVDPLRLPN